MFPSHIPLVVFSDWEHVCQQLSALITIQALSSKVASVQEVWIWLDGDIHQAGRLKIVIFALQRQPLFIHPWKSKATII